MNDPEWYLKEAHDHLMRALAVSSYEGERAASTTAIAFVQMAVAVEAYNQRTRFDEYDRLQEARHARPRRPDEEPLTGDSP